MGYSYSCGGGQKYPRPPSSPSYILKSYTRLLYIFVQYNRLNLEVVSLRLRGSAGVIDPSGASANSWHPYIFITEAQGSHGRLDQGGSEEPPLLSSP